MLTARVRLAGELFRELVVRSVITSPPGSPFAKYIVAAIRRCEVRIVRSDFPLHFCIRQPSSGKISCCHRKICATTRKQVAFVVPLRGNFKLRPAKLFYSETVLILLLIKITYVTVRFELDSSSSEIDVCR